MGGSKEREEGGANGWQSPVHEMTIDLHKRTIPCFATRLLFLLSF